MISHAQNFEDVILHRLFHGVERGCYIDAGAWDPDQDSVTKHFYDRGWSGLNIEPVPRFHERFVRKRPRDINLNCVVSDTEGELSFKEYGESGLSTLREQFRPETVIGMGYPRSEYKVRSVTLASLVRELNLGEVHFLKIDVEGAEREVLLGADLRRFRPWVVLVEAIQPKLPGDDPFGFEPTWPAWEDLLIGNGYRFGLFDGVNRFYYREESPELGRYLQAPANITDGFLLHPRHPLVPSAWTAPAVALAYDLTDVVGWPGNDLTGIQRVSIGILNGLVEAGEAVQPVAFDPRAGDFAPVGPDAFPPRILRHFSPRVREMVSGAARPGGTGPAPSQTAREPLRARLRALARRSARNVLRPFPALFSLAQRSLDGTRRRWRHWRGRPAFIAPGRILLSLGKNWGHDARNERMLELQRSGVRIHLLIHDLMPLVEPAFLHPCAARTPSSPSRSSPAAKLSATAKAWG
jgi:FkbM family methyltransferase